MPQQVTFSDGSTIIYSYAADGTKLRAVHVINGTTTQKDYCGNVVYENGVQKILLTEEGYVDLTASTPTYYYYLKDHQGNNRVVVNSSGTVQETNHYYPFGGVFANTGNVQPYKYNGKELDTKKGLNWYDYGARHYDASLGRWFVVDPLAEKMSSWSPYAYCFNNPVKYVDEDGELPWLAGLIGGAIDYAAQVTVNRIQGKSWSASFTDVDVSTIAISAVSSMAGVGLTNVVGKALAASNIAKASTSAGKVLNSMGEVVVDASVSASEQFLKEGTISSEEVINDVLWGIAGNSLGDEVKYYLQNSQEGQCLENFARHLENTASRRKETKRAKQAKEARKTANNYGNSSKEFVENSIDFSKETISQYNEEQKRHK